MFHLTMPSENSIRLVWVVPVDPDDLIARVEAYSETRPQVSALQQCREDGAPSLIAKLPTEVAEMVVSELEDSVYRDKITPWLRWRECRNDTCTDESHETPRDKLRRKRIQTQMDAVYAEFGDHYLDEVLIEEGENMQIDGRLRHLNSMHDRVMYLECFEKHTNVINVSAVFPM